MPNQNGFDRAKAKAFGGRMVGVINNAAIALMGSIGYQVGLFDTLAAISPTSPARTSGPPGADAAPSEARMAAWA